MTDENRGIGGTVGPPWSVDLLADLHAGVLDEAVANRLWPQVNADPEARAILDALDSTVADLGALPMAPAAPMPPEVATRIDAALAAEVSRTAEPGRDEPPVAPVVSLDNARRKRNRMLGWGAGVLTAAAAAVVAVAVIVPNGQQGDGLPAAAPTPADTSTPPLSLRSEGGLGSALGEVSGVRDFGPLGDEQRLDACLEAAGIDPDVKPAGVRPATLDGREAVLVLYTTGEFAQFRLVALSPDCGPDNPEVLLDKTVGKGAGG